MATISSIGPGRDFATPQGWYDAYQPGGWIGELYNDVEYSQLFGATKASSATNYILLRCAPGHSFRDHASAKTNPLKYDQSKGVGFRTVGAYCIYFDSPFTTMEGIQIQSTSVSQASFYASSNAPNATIDGCLIEGDNASTTNVATIAWLSDGTIKNSIVISRNNTIALGCGFSGNRIISNCTFVSTFAGTNTKAGIDCSTTATSNSSFCYNSAIFGFLKASNGPVSDPPGFIGSNNGSDVAITFGTSNQQNKIYANQFVSITDASRDFRTKTGSDLINTGFADSAHIPSNVDITGTIRPQGSQWDIGAWELITGFQISKTFMMGQSTLGTIRTTKSLTMSQRSNIGITRQGGIGSIGWDAGTTNGWGSIGFDDEGWDQQLGIGWDVGGFDQSGGYVPGNPLENNLLFENRATVTRPFVLSTQLLSNISVTKIISHSQTGNILRTITVPLSLLSDTLIAFRDIAIPFALNATVSRSPVIPFNTKALIQPIIVLPLATTGLVVRTTNGLPFSSLSNISVTRSPSFESRGGVSTKAILPFQLLAAAALPYIETTMNMPFALSGNFSKTIPMNLSLRSSIQRTLALPLSNSSVISRIIEERFGSNASIGITLPIMLQKYLDVPSPMVVPLQTLSNVGLPVRVLFQLISDTLVAELVFNIPFTFFGEIARKVTVPGPFMQGGWSRDIVVPYTQLSNVQIVRPIPLMSTGRITRDSVIPVSQTSEMRLVVTFPFTMGGSLSSPATFNIPFMSLANIARNQSMYLATFAVIRTDLVVPVAWLADVSRVIPIRFHLFGHTSPIGISFNIPFGWGAYVRPPIHQIEGSRMGFAICHQLVEWTEAAPCPFKYK